MEATVRHSTTVKTYLMDVKGGEVRDCAYSQTGRRYRVEQIRVEKANGNVSSVTLKGPVLKKDGTDGANWHDERMWQYKDWPAWLDSIVWGLA